MTFAEIAARLGADGVPTAHGGPWRPSTLHRVAVRASA
jgi:hypothetical protein